DRAQTVAERGDGQDARVSGARASAARARGSARRVVVVRSGAMRAAVLSVALVLAAHAASADETTAMARQLLDELVATDPSNPPGNEEKATKLVAARLRAAGIEPVIVPFGPGRANLVARLKGDGTKK